MTATDELRAMLDERVAEWRRTPHYSSESVDNETVFQGEGIEWLAHDHLNGRLGLRTCRYEVTPRQAIAATLGDVPRLPYFWTADGTLHIELPKLPESISVRLPGQRDRDVGSARTWQYTQGSGTCHMEYCDEWSGDELYPTEAYVCSACSYVTVDGKPNYCPNCGRKAVDAC